MIIFVRFVVALSARNVGGINTLVIVLKDLEKTIVNCSGYVFLLIKKELVRIHCKYR